MKSLSLTVVLLGLLEPTTRHEQVRDDWGLAWLLLENDLPMIVRVPDTGVLRLRVRARGAQRVRVRAAGELVTQRRLVPGTDPGAGFPGSQPSPMIELRVSVPGGGESYRVEVDQGAAWLAPSYVDPKGQSHRYELPEAASPPLVDLGSETEPALALIPPKDETEAEPELALVPPTEPQPDLVPMDDQPMLIVPPKDDSLAAPPLVALEGEEKPKTEPDRDFALEWPSDRTDREKTVDQPSKRPRPQPARPKGPSLMARLGNAVNGFFSRGLRYSLGGDAEVGMDRVGARATAELILPMLQERFSALAYAGYRPSSLRGVAVTGNGVALPVVVEAQQNDLPLGVALRWRSDRMRPAGIPMRLHIQGALNWVRRQQGLSIETLRASRREVVSTASQTRAGLGLGLSTRIGQLIVEGTAGLDLGPASAVDLAGLAQADYPALSGLVNLGARWRFGDVKLPSHLKALDRSVSP